MGKSAVGGAGGILVGGRIEVDKFELGVVGDRDDAKRACSTAVDERVAQSNRAHIEGTEGTSSETAINAVLEEVRVAASIWTLRA